MKQRQEIQQKSRLGTLLIHKGIISRQQLDQALTIQGKTGARLGEVLVNQGWITEKQLGKVLKKQSRYRFIAAISAMLLGPFQPFMSNTHATETPVFVSEQSFSDRTGMAMLTDDALASATGQADMVSNYDKLVDLVKGEGGAEDAALTSLESVVGAIFPGSNLLDAEMEISGVEYAPGPRTRVNPDGSLDVAVPARIKKVAFHNVKVAGSSDEYLGDIIVRDIHLENVRVNIKLRP